MNQIDLPDLVTLRGQIGRELAVSDWVTVSQERIDAFAGATGDRQWIHLDAARAAAESPLGTTIALFSAVASGIMIVTLVLLPETRGRSLASLEAAPADPDPTLAPLTGRGQG